MKDFYYNQIQLFIERLNHYIESSNDSEIQAVDNIKRLIIESVKDLMSNREKNLKNNFKRINESFMVLGL